MEQEIWHITGDFSKLLAKDVLRNVVRDDKKNYDRAESELGEDIELLDDAITLYIGSLQAAYRLIDKWKDNVSNRAAIAMMISALNYIVLARHGLMLGYYPEVCDLFRSCYERISRCYLFFHGEKFSRRFLSGEQIGQSEVDKELSRLEDLDKRNELLRSLRTYYGSMSDVAHPNLNSFAHRYGERELDKRVGLEFVFGGIMSSKLGHVTIIRLLQTVLSGLRILGVIIDDESGGWDKEYRRISAKCKEMVGSL